MALGFYGQADRKLIERCAITLEKIEQNTNKALELIAEAIAEGNALVVLQQTQTNNLLQEILDTLKSEQAGGHPAVALKFEFGAAVNK